MNRLKGVVSRKSLIALAVAEILPLLGITAHSHADLTVMFDLSKKCGRVRVRSLYLLQ